MASLIDYSMFRWVGRSPLKMVWLVWWRFHVTVTVDMCWAAAAAAAINHVLTEYRSVRWPLASRPVVLTESSQASKPAVMSIIREWENDRIQPANFKYVHTLQTLIHTQTGINTSLQPNRLSRNHEYFGCSYNLYCHNNIKVQSSYCFALRSGSIRNRLFTMAFYELAWFRNALILTNISIYLVF